MSFFPFGPSFFAQDRATLDDTVRVCPGRRSLLRGLVGLPALGFLGLCAALEADLDRFERTATARYGKQVTDIVRAWRELLAHVSSLDEGARLAPINNFFNRRIQYVTDNVQWKAKDYWATPMEVMGVGAGDCEDFAIAKYMSLRLAGVPNERMRMIYVRARAGAASIGVDEAHMVLGYFATPNAEPLILDNLIGDIRPAARRRDLSPVFSFNSEGLWVGGGATSQADPTARLSRWRDLLERMRKEGLG